MAGNDSTSNVGSKGKAATEPAPPPLAPVATDLPSTVKVAFPDTFDGNRKKLKSFMIQVELWLAFNAKYFTRDVDKILWTVALLRGSASDWISSFLADHMSTRNVEGLCTSGASKATQAIFVSWKGFAKQLTLNFGDIDAKRTAMTTLGKLKQTGSAVSYTAVFQQYANQTNWNDESLCFQYYEGLKDYVKDEISRSDRPDDLKEMIELAQKIDNRHYERQMEKKGGSNHKHWNQKKGQRRDYWPQPMELDATFKPNGKQHKTHNPNKERQLKERLCFNCNKPGHMARNCKSPRKGGNGRRNGKQLNATWQGQINATFTGRPDWGINGDSTPEEEGSSDEESEAESLTTSEQGTYDELVPGGATFYGYKELVKHMTKVAHTGIKKAAEKPNAEHTLPKVKDLYKKKLEDLPRQAHLEKRGNDLWDLYNRINKTRQSAGTSTEVEEIADECAERLKGKITIMKYQKKPEGIEDLYQLFKSDLLQYEARTWNMLQPKRPKPTIKIERKAMEQLDALNESWKQQQQDLTKTDATETDHPWHPYVYWEYCSTDMCMVHMRKKNQYSLYPKSSPVIHFQDSKQVHALRRSQSEGELPLKAEQVFEECPREVRGPSSDEDEQERYIPPHLLREAERAEKRTAASTPSQWDSDESKN
ncbi:hypothetical protein V491_08927 [Pseudogymnoascus sp. VKM F-3775]|nr:hypothetical protein V491_08927 [Pseudogymnoascus sp. VKM F-3775]